MNLKLFSQKFYKVDQSCSLCQALMCADLYGQSSKGVF